uniref:Uncharacterized protein n=1 Tax=Romanomermis culicivorax TaxID=13658 RepID=A0A915HZG0_ROMCU
MITLYDIQEMIFIGLSNITPLSIKLINLATDKIPRKIITERTFFYGKHLDDSAYLQQAGHHHQPDHHEKIFKFHGCYWYACPKCMTMLKLAQKVLMSEQLEKSSNCKRWVMQSLNLECANC